MAFLSNFLLFYDNGVQLEFYSVDFLSPPSSENEHVVIRSGTSVGAYIEMITMSLYCVYNLFRVGTAVHTYPVYTDAVPFKSCENPFKCMLLTEKYICIAITVLYANYMLTNNRYCGTVSGELLVCGFGVIFSRFYKLVVKIVLLSFA